MYIALKTAYRPETDQGFKNHNIHRCVFLELRIGGVKIFIKLRLCCEPDLSLRPGSAGYEVCNRGQTAQSP